MPIYVRLVSSLKETVGTEVDLATIPRRGDHVMARNKLYLVEEICHWDVLKQQPVDRPLVVLQVKEVDD